MTVKFSNIIAVLGLTVILAIVSIGSSKAQQSVKAKPRILISSDIGGTDPDDNQSMIHLLTYANLFQIEGLVSSPYGKGRKQDFLDMIDLYAKDFNELKKHATDFPDPDSLRAVCKQGALPGAAFKGYDRPTEGSNWIIKCAKERSDQPLWVLVWGGLEDLAQALHDAPEIEKNIKVYWIGGPNKKWSVNAYAYIAGHFPNLWIIENNATYRGWIIDAESPENLKADAYYHNFIEGHGAMGKAFINYYGGSIKMGDTPSLVYVMNGDPDDPLGESWGGRFAPINRSARVIFNRNTTIADTVAAYGVVEWRFKGPNLTNSNTDSVCFTMDVAGQQWPGYYLGNGVYGIRYSSKQPETCTYTTSSGIAALNGITGQFVSTVPWPGKPNPDDYKLGVHWYSDRQEPELFFGKQQGARTISKYRKAFLQDWAKRWKWLE